MLLAHQLIAGVRGPTSNSITINPTTTTNYTVIGSVGTCTNSAVSTVTVHWTGACCWGTILFVVDKVLCFPASGGSLYAWSTGITTPHYYSYSISNKYFIL